MNTKNMKALRAYVDGPFREHYAKREVDMTVWKCGTKACLAGWVAIDGVIPKLLIADVGNFEDALCWTSTRGKKHLYEHAVRRAFGLLGKQADRLFGYTSPANPDEILKTIDEILGEHK
jgi:hypothetical protein